MSDVREIVRIALAALTLLTLGVSVRADFGGAIPLYDNGDPDWLNGYGNGTEEAVGARRTLLDDFVVPDGETWVIKQLHWLHLWGTPSSGNMGTGVEVSLWTDAAGAPGAPFTTLALTCYEEMFTGNLAFEREEMHSWAAFEPVVLEAGHYWFEANILGPEQNFWLTATPVQNNECWVNYDDLGGLQPGTVQFGVAADLSWTLEGLIQGTGSGACCLSKGACSVEAFVDCGALGGFYLGDGSTCGLETCGEPGGCCLPDGSCAQTGELFCDGLGGVFLGAAVSCVGFDCGSDGPCGTLATPDEYGAGVEPSDVDLGDLDGDGDPDMVIVNNGGSLTVRLNNGEGEFGPRTDTSTPIAPKAVALGDLDGDLDLDVAVVSRNTVSVYLNTGDGTWQPRVDYAVSSGPRDLVMADLDGDLDLDLAVVRFDGDSVGVLLNDGNGGFGPVATYDVGDRPISIAAGDADGDLDVDLLVAQGSPVSSMSLLRNEGDGTFAPQEVTGLLSGRVPDIAVADIDGDLDLDVVTTDFDAGEVSILFNDGNGVYDERTSTPVLPWCRNVILADFDGDGDLDVVVDTIFAFSSLAIIFNNGQGLFGPVTRMEVDGQPTALTAADIDGDDDIDLVVTREDDDAVLVFKNRCVECRADLDDSNSVDFGDILRILSAWGDFGGPEDLDRSGVVDFGDLLLVLARWGPCFPGACCLADGSCAGAVSAESCAVMGGKYQGEGTLCVDACLGACCLADGSCLEATVEIDCAEQGGVYGGDGSRCVLACAQGACCFGDGTCVEVAAVICDELSGTYFGDGTLCADTCLGACCFEDGSCLAPLVESVCVDAGGFYDGDGTDCESGCPTGACCFPDGSCTDDALEIVCVFQGGGYQGDGTVCAGTCLGACCFEDLVCLDAQTETDCILAGGDYRGDGTTCLVECPFGACCFPESCVNAEADACAAMGGTYRGDGTTCTTSCDLSRDDCADALVFDDGVYFFSTIGSSTDGPPMPRECDEGNGLDFVKDVWFRYQALCDGTATASVCDAAYNTRMAVYADGDCPGALVDCSDDACGVGGTRSLITFPVAAGEVYFVRIGSRTGSIGTGALSLDCVGSAR